MTDKVLLRKAVRVILSAVPNGRKASEDLIFAKLSPDFHDLRVDEMRLALEWNLAKGHVISSRDDDEERDTWCLTSEGRKKEGLA